MNTGTVVPLAKVGSIFKATEKAGGMRVAVFAHDLLLGELGRRGITCVDSSPLDQSNLLMVTPREFGLHDVWELSEVVDAVRRHKPNSRLFPVKKILGLVRCGVCRESKDPIIIATNPIAKKFRDRTGYFLFVISDAPFTGEVRQPTLYFEEKGDRPTVTKDQLVIFWKGATN